jgi:chemotaxis signal transduction protein
VRAGEVRCGVPVARVREVVRLVRLCRVPEARSPFRGLLSLRGEVVTVMDLASLDAVANSGGRPLTAQETTGASTGSIKPHRVESVVVLRGGKDPLGLEVDGVEEIREFPAVDPSEGPGAPGSPRNRGGLWSGAVRDGNREIGVLDAERVIATAEALASERAEPLEVKDRG